MPLAFQAGASGAIQGHEINPALTQIMGRQLNLASLQDQLKAARGKNKEEKHSQADTAAQAF